MSSFTAAGTSYATWGEPMIPFYIFYSMFGFQRVGDLMWAFGDMRGRGFLLGATAGRTTLNGEGLQHQDGHSLLLASSVPNLAAYDPAFAYEVAVHHRRTASAACTATSPRTSSTTSPSTTRTTPCRPCPTAPRTGSSRASTASRRRPGSRRRAATILFSGTAQAAAREAQQLLAEHHDVAAELWSVTSYKALREDALAAERWNRLHPSELRRVPYITETLLDCEGPVGGRHRLHEGGARPGGPLGPRPLHRPRHRRLRPLGLPRRPTPPLRDRRRPPGGHRAGRRWPTSTTASAEEVADAIADYGLDAEAIEPRHGVGSG